MPLRRAHLLDSRWRLSSTVPCLCLLGVWDAFYRLPSLVWFIGLLYWCQPLSLRREHHLDFRRRLSSLALRRCMISLNFCPVVMLCLHTFGAPGGACLGLACTPSRPAGLLLSPVLHSLFTRTFALMSHFAWHRWPSVVCFQRTLAQVSSHACAAFGLPRAPVVSAPLCLI